MNPQKYDAIVIGSGQAGVPLSFRFADLGWQVALIEKDAFGGTCINTGCTPTKIMVHRAQVMHYARNAARWGVHAENVSADLGAILAQKDKVVQRFRGGKEKQMGARANLHFYKGSARFVAAHQLHVHQAGGEVAVLESDKIFINTGGRARIPDIPGIDDVNYFTNENIMDVTELPEHLIVLGGGYIGLEFGQMFRRFGSRVTILHNSNQIVSHEDPEVAAELQKILAEEGIEFRLRVQTTRAEQKVKSVVISMEGSEGPVTISGSHLLVATGRRPNTSDLDLAEAGIETDQHGFIKVNYKLETNVPGVWALGT